MERKPLKIGITQGDVNGISYEVILKTLADAEVYEGQAVVLYGSSRAAEFYKQKLEIDLPLVRVASAAQAAFDKVSMVDCCDPSLNVEPGQSTQAAGKAAFDALEAAVRDIKAGQLDVLVTGPINKANIQSDQFRFPGHTEYLEQCFAEEGQKALMLLVGETLRVAVATGHISVDEVARCLSVPMLLEKIQALNFSLKQDFGLDRPRIAVLALNPHAGDGGLIGQQEQDVIAPAVEQAQKEGICCFGPVSADGFFGSDRYSSYDGILAMYHDQGLIPFKTLAMDRGVNFTAGLPVVRTSPDHGTAYDLAGTGQAS